MGGASGLGAARGITWRVEDEFVASIKSAEKAPNSEENGELDVWVVTGLEEGEPKMTAAVTVKSLLDDAELLSASLVVTVTAGNRESETAEPHQGGCGSFGMNAAGIGLALVFCLAPVASRRKKRTEN